MDIKNFQNPWKNEWQPGGKYDPNWLGSSNPFGRDDDLFEIDPNAPMGSEWTQRQGDRPHTRISAPKGHKEESSVGGQKIFLEDNGKTYRSRTKNKELGYDVGDVLSFEQGGRKYKARWDNNNQFQGYYSGNKPYHPKFNIGNKTYYAHSIKTMAGRDDKYDNTGDFNGIQEISDIHMQTMLAYGTLVFHIWNTQPIEQTTRFESVGGLLDFKDVFYDYYEYDIQTLVLYKGLVYNSNEIGNLIWGMVLDYHGIFIDPNLIAELGTPGRNDEAWEQAAISRGKLVSKRLNTLETKTIIRHLIPILREEFNR